MLVERVRLWVLAPVALTGAIIMVGAQRAGWAGMPVLIAPADRALAQAQTGR
jgi:hypothetical protein